MPHRPANCDGRRCCKAPRLVTRLPVVTLRMPQAMVRFILRRAALGVLVAFTVMTLAFMLTRLSGDLAISIAGQGATQQDIEIIRKAYGLDRPVVIQFVNWMGRAAIGDLG